MSRAGVRRGRALAAVVASVGLLAGTAVLSTGSAHSAAPPSDCAEAYPVDEIVDGALLEGLTVDRGTTPEPFTGEILGVLDGGIAPGLDMVIARLASPEIDRVGGIWQGMSGSPVYAEDGRLIGAVAYGLAFGASPVAGITPFEDMDDYLGTEAPGRIKVGDSLSREIAAETDVSKAQAAEGMRQLPMPLGVSGLAPERLAKVKGRDYLSKNAYVVGSRSGPAAPSPDTVVAGGNIAAALSYGDIAAAGVGTATSVCDGEVVGFGHPMAFAGETTLSLHPADAIYVQEDPLGAPFKVANLGEPAGTITDDHLTGITGGFGALPETSSVTSAVSFGGRSREGTSFVTVPAANAQTTFYQFLANHDRVVDGVIAGSEVQSWTVRGTDADGSPYSLGFTERYASNFDITFDSVFELADLVYGLSSMPGVTVDDVSVDSAVTNDASTYTVSAVEQKRGGQWVKLSRKSPALAKAGKALTLRAVLTAPDRTRYAKYSFKMPKKARGFQGGVEIFGGGESYSEAAYQPTVQKIAKALKATVRNDEVQAAMVLFGERRGRTVKTAVTDPVDRVVYGGRSVRLLVR